MAPSAVLPNPKQKVKDPKKSKPKTFSTTTEEDATGNPPEATNKLKALSGLPVGSPIVTGMTAPSPTGWSGGKPVSGQIPVTSRATYTAEDIYKIPATLSNSQKANLLLQLSLIPGLYAKGEAPTQEYIKSMGAAVSFTPEDYTAFTKLLTAADTNGQHYTTTLGGFINNPKLAQQYFGKVTPAVKKIALSSPDALKADLNARFLDIFDMRADNKIATSYVKEINTLENKAGLAGQAISPQQREDIFNKFVTQAANNLFAKVKGTADTADDALLEKGALGATVRLIRNAHADNGIPIQPKDVYKIAISASRSQQALQNALDDINMQASVQFPALKDWLSKGKTAKQFFAPYTTAYSNIYGVPEDQVDVTKFHDIAAGPSIISVNQWIKNQWKNPDIQKTDYYKGVHRNDLRAVAEAFGMTV